MSVDQVPKNPSMTLSSGNILNWSTLKRKVPKSSTEEIKFCVHQTLTKCCDGRKEGVPCLGQDEITLADTQNSPSQQHENREDIKVTVKLMITKSDEEEVTEALDKVLKELEIAKVDVALLAVSQQPNVIEDFSFEHLKPLWWQMEREVTSGRVGALGICDADKAMLEELHNWARIKPIINQINQETCCVIPPDLSAYAKANKIQLLTHNDASEVLPPEDFQGVLAEFFSEKDSRCWYPAWTVRFTVLIRCRGVITTKGYILKAVKDTDDNSNIQA